MYTLDRQLMTDAIRTAVATAAILIVTLTQSVPSLARPGPVATTSEKLHKLESLRFDEVCGVGELGQTLCLSATLEKVWLPQTVTTFIRPGHATSISISDGAKCGVDTEGVKCFGTSQKDFDLKALIESSSADTVQTSAQNACGLSNRRTTLHCLTGEWTIDKKPEFTINTAQPISAIGVANSLICWAEKNTISCKADRWGWAPAPMTFSQVQEILVGEEWLCARNHKAVQCWFQNQNPVTLVDDFLTASHWTTDGVEFCALSKDQRLICADFKSGHVAPPKNHLIPVQYAQPNSGVIDLWLGPYRELCVLKKKDEAVECWNMIWGQPDPIPFSDSVLELHGSISVPCALLKNGSVECRSRSSHNSRSLPQAGRIHVEFGGYNRCYWNERGIDCPGRMDRVDFLNIKAASSSPDGESLCVFGADVATSRDTIACYGWNTEVRNTPTDLANVIQLSVEADNACAISDDGSSNRTLTCWGNGYRGEPFPAQLFSPSKVLVSSRHACALDKFGLLCWGDLATLGLTIPPGLEQPGKVVDFALGSNRTCAILDTGEVQCWGKLYSEDQNPPPMTSATSIVGSGASLFCALNQPTAGQSELHCWGGNTPFPQ